MIVWSERPLPNGKARVKTIILGESRHREKPILQSRGVYLILTHKPIFSKQRNRIRLAPRALQDDGSRCEPTGYARLMAGCRIKKEGECRAQAKLAAAPTAQ